MDKRPTSILVENALVCHNIYLLKESVTNHQYENLSSVSKRHLIHLVLIDWNCNYSSVVIYFNIHMCDFSKLESQAVYLLLLLINRNECSAYSFRNKNMVHRSWHTMKKQVWLQYREVKLSFILWNELYDKYENENISNLKKILNEKYD